MGATGGRDDARVLELLDAQKVFKGGGVTTIAVKDLSAIKDHARELAGLVGVGPHSTIDAMTVFRVLDPNFIAALISSPEPIEAGVPSACIVRRSTDELVPADLICLDLDALGGVAAALSWLDAHVDADSARTVIVAVGKLRVNLAEFEDRVDGVISAPPDRGLANSWLKVLRDWWKRDEVESLAETDPRLELGGIEFEELDAALVNAALDDNDPRKQD